MGSAAAAHAASRGMRVLGVERFGPAHDRGSSHGSTRIIRQAYFESPDYVPLLRRAYELWDALAARTSTTLRAQTGGLFVGRPETPVVAGTLASALHWQLAHQVYDAADLRRRFPAVRPRDEEIGVYEAIAGALFPEAGVQAHLDVATAAGAELRFSVQATGWDADDRGVRVALADGTRAEAERLTICAGPWFARVAPELGVPLRVERNVQFWFAPAAAGTFLRAAPCMYTLTPDEHFVIGPHPGQPRVVLVGGFSGHGYKFAPVVGEIVAALLANDDPGFDLGLFAPARFAPAV